MNGIHEAQMSESAQNVNRTIGTKKEQDLTREKIKNRLYYNPDTGVFVWINPSKFHKEKLNMVAGTIRNGRCNKKYLWIGLDGAKYTASRLAFIYMTGIIPKYVDHMNGDTLDNRFCNLNNVDHFKNAQNHAKTINCSGLPVGVRKSKSGRYVSRIKVNKKAITIGTFDTIEEASEAYISERIKLHYCPCINKVYI